MKEEEHREENQSLVRYSFFFPFLSCLRRRLTENNVPFPKCLYPLFFFSKCGKIHNF